MGKNGGWSSGENKGVDGGGIYVVAIAGQRAMVKGIVVVVVAATMVVVVLMMVMRDGCENSS